MWLPPVWLARSLERLRGELLRVHRRLALPPVALLELAMGAWLSQALWAAARLGVADALADGPRTAAELAVRLQVDEHALARLLRALSVRGVFRRQGERYALNALSRALQRTGEGSVRDYILFLGDPKHRARWSQLDRTIREGRAPDDFFAELTRDRELAATFDAGMTSLSRLAATALSYDFSHFDVIVDVGGGRGSNLLGILARTPHAQGVLFDLPSVVPEAQPRMRVESGSFFERVPEGGDAYVLKHILHDWSDAKASVILHNVRRAMPAHGTLVIIESVVPDDTSDHMAKWIDLEMLTIGGKERSEREWRALLTACGFTLTRIVATAGPVSVLEARPSDTSDA